MADLTFGLPSSEASRPSRWRRQRWYETAIMALLLTVCAGGAYTIDRLPSAATLNLSIPKNEYFAGEAIPVTLTYSNSSHEPVYLSPYEPASRHRQQTLTWVVTGPGGRVPPVARPPAMAFGYTGFTQRGKELSHGVTISEDHHLNDWVFLGTPGTYEIEVRSRQVSSDVKAESGGFPLSSNRIRITVRPATPGDIAATISRYEPILSETCNSHTQADAASTSKSEVLHAARSIQYLHALDAIPTYLRYLECPSVGNAMSTGMFAIPETSATLEALTTYLSDPDRPITDSARTLYYDLSGKLKGRESFYWFAGQEETRAQLQSLAKGKAPHAQLATSITLARSGFKPGQGNELTAYLPNLDSGERQRILSMPGLVATGDAIRHIEACLEDPDERTRSLALEALVKTGEERFVNLYLRDVTSGNRNFTTQVFAHDLPAPLTESQQLFIAEALSTGPKKNVMAGFRLLSESATTTAILPHLRKALDWTSDGYFTHEKGLVLIAMAKVDRKGSRDIVLHAIRNGLRATPEADRLFIRYADDKEFDQYNWRLRQ